MTTTWCFIVGVICGMPLGASALVCLLALLDRARGESVPQDVLDRLDRAGKLDG